MTHCTGQYDDGVTDGNLTRCSVRLGCGYSGCPDRVAAALRAAKTAFDSLPAAQRAHQRHLQRISFATGNVALSTRDADVAAIRERAAKAAGPCPCGECAT
jgi:hypothetical protein